MLYARSFLSFALCLHCKVIKKDCASHKPTNSSSLKKIHSTVKAEIKTLAMQNQVVKIAKKA
jgi:hypothetical protein